MNAFTEKLREVAVAIIPIVVSVLLLHFLITPLEGEVLARFLLGSFLIIVGMPLFLLGVDLSIGPMGESMSQSLVQTRKMQIVMGGSFLVGFIISIAEPDLHILARQVASVTNNLIPQFLLVLVVSLGIGLLLAMGMYRILKNIPLNRFMLITYALIFVLALFSSGDYLAIAFDASGSTTGSVTVPFLLAMAAGTAAITKSSEVEEDTNSFGLLGITSAGAIVGVLLLGIIRGGGDLTGELPLEQAVGAGIFAPFLGQLPQTAWESILSLLPILIMFFIMNAVSIRISRRAMRRLVVGILYTIIGLILFLTGVNAGFLEATRHLGYALAANGNMFLLVLVGVIFGVLTIPAEPSVHVLTKQIEEETAGALKATTVMLSLCIGVGLAVGLSILRILIPALQLWHILLPGMIIALVLSFTVPNIFVGIAFDSGGVAAGTMTATFILPFAQGVAEYIPSASVLTDGFGVITLVAMTPLITVQLMGFIYQMRTKHDTRRREEEVYE